MTPSDSESLEKIRLERNFFKLYGYSFFQSFLIVIPVIVPFWQKKGLSLQEIFMLQGVFGFALILFDAPAGYLADLFGRKKTLVIGSIISALGFQILWFGQTFLDFVVYEIVVGIGLSLQSGCDIAILYHSIEKLNIAGSKAKFLGRRVFYLSIGEAIASVLGGLLAGISLNWPAYANAMSVWMTVLFAFSVYEPSGQKLSRESHLKNFRQIGKALFGHSKLLSLILSSFILYGFATYCAVWSLQPYWKSRGLDYTFFGYLWAANCVLVALISRFAHRFETRFGSTRVVIIIGLMPIIGYFGMGFTGGLIGLIFTMAFPVCRGLNQVIFQDAINSRVPAEMRATINSVGSLGMRALFIVFGPIIGRALDHGGPDHAMKILGFAYVGIFLMVSLPILALRKQFRIG